MEPDFEDLRPYRSSEIPAAMERIVADPAFEGLARYVFPDRSVEEVRRLLRNITTADQFQSQVMACANRRILADSVSEFTYDGLEHVPKEGALFVSNHRDIVLDSALLQQVFHENGLPTTEITFGSNLLSSQLLADIGRSNKLFKVLRGGNRHEFLAHTHFLSGYLRDVVRSGRSIWIAQRNGRTKDGLDATDQGLIKLFSLSADGNPVDGFAELHITPVAISYEIEPCDLLKTREIYLTRRNGSYEKQPGEDLKSIQTGIRQQKGRVHISICRPIAREELARLGHLEKGELHKAIAALIDWRIYSNYKLFDTNYIAHDLRSGKSRFADRYTAAEKARFEARLQETLFAIDGDKTELREIFLGIYANPVDTAVDA